MADYLIGTAFAILLYASLTAVFNNQSDVTLEEKVETLATKSDLAEFEEKLDKLIEIYREKD